MSKKGQRDQYGGFEGIKFKATGFFRLEKTDRWWLVTPEGNAFLSFGVNHTEPSWLTAEYNIDYWAKEFGVKDKNDKTQFYPGMLEKVKKDLELIGMNTLGCHTADSGQFYNESFVPYVAQFRFVEICHYMIPTNEEFHDVFSQEFFEHCDQIAKAFCLPKKDDPFLLGYSMTDCPIFTNLDAAPRIGNIYGSPRHGLPQWPVVLRNLSKDSAGKKVYVDLIKKIYDENIDAFNSVYHTSFGSFDDLLYAKNWRPSEDSQNEKEIEDNLEFLYIIIDKSYEVEVSAIRKYDTNHLIFGDKLNGNTNTPDEIVKIADKYFDLIFYQYYAYLENQVELLERWTKLTDKAFFMGDSALAMASERGPDPYGPHCISQDHRAEHFTKMFNNLFSRPYYVGWNWCGWMDAWKELQTYKQHSGLQTPFGDFHKPILKAMQEFSANMYDIHSQND